jgi:hypothetical protein
MSSFTEEEIKLNPGVCDLDGNTYAMFLINCNIFDIPDYAKHNSAIQNYNGETCAMLHLKHNPDQALPKWMEHNPVIQDHNGLTAAMYWIQYNNVNLELPSWTQHDPAIQSENGYTAAMYWIEYTRGINPPHWMQHEPTIQDKNGNTAAMWWCMNNPTINFEDWMNHDPAIQNKDGKTFSSYKDASLIETESHSSLPDIEKRWFKLSSKINNVISVKLMQS